MMSAQCTSSAKTLYSPKGRVHDQGGKSRQPPPHRGRPHESLQRRCHPSAFGRQVRSTSNVTTGTMSAQPRKKWRWAVAPRLDGAQDGVQRHIGDAHHEHDHEPMADLPFWVRCALPGVRSARRPHDSRNRQNEEPEKLGGFEFQMFAQNAGADSTCKEHTVERYPHWPVPARGTWAGAQRPIPAHQVPHVEGAGGGLGAGFRAAAGKWVITEWPPPVPGTRKYCASRCVQKATRHYDGCHGRCHPWK